MTASQALDDRRKPRILDGAPGPCESLYLLLRAFANGCTAMTGVEAVSNGTPLFHSPTEIGARRTLTAIVSCLVVLLAGVALLAFGYGVTATMPGEPGYESILSRIIAAVVGRGPFYYLTIASIVTVLAFSANTSFADFPRVCRMLASDRFLPEPFVHRGRRLAFSHGIIVLAVLSAMLLIFFEGITDALIPLFAIGALSAFTASQTGMVAHWRKRGGAHARRAVILNTTGAAATGATLLVVLVSKFQEGVEPRWYHHLLHNHTASMMKTLLLFRGGPQTVLVNTPFYLRDWRPERKWLKHLRSARVSAPPVWRAR